MHLLHLQLLISTTRKFGQNVDRVYPAFDRDNLFADPVAAVSVADNETIGLVKATDGATPTPANDPKRSITKEATVFLLTDTGWATRYQHLTTILLMQDCLVYKNLLHVLVMRRARKINIRETADGTVSQLMLSSDIPLDSEIW